VEAISEAVDDRQANPVAAAPLGFTAKIGPKDFLDLTWIG
jgi:hypothetical protein